ncbi:hypothetical protein HZA55_01885 [Candidatus Poribacteria bacterium]|nr:hypothetical protein [Candidatus Poribacteria bacterium]
MIDPKIKERYQRLTDVKFIEQRNQLDLEIQKINQICAAEGLYGSGYRLSQLHTLLSRELEIRTILVWENLVRVHRLLGSLKTDTIREDFKKELKLNIEQIYDELSDKLKLILKDTPLNNKLNLDDVKSLAISKHEIEIDLYIDSIDKTSNNDIDMPLGSQQYNFYGNIGTIQTGAGASANVIQNLGQEDKSALITALELVKEQLDAFQNISENKKEEIKEIAEECIRESNNQKPNNTKLLTLLNALGTTIQTFASVQPAYQALKAALIPLGILLP